MKALFGLAMVALTALLVVGCVTAPPNPTSTSDTLFVGQLVFNLTGFKKYGAATVNGSQKNMVEVTLRNVFENTSVTVETHDPNGMFFASGLKPGDYEIVRLYYKASVGSAWTDVILRPGTVLDFRPAPVGVTNVGKITASFDNGVSNSVKSPKGYTAVDAGFAKQFPKSAWNSAKWSSVPAFRNNG